MKRALSYTAAIIGLAIGLFGANAFAQTTAVGPYYATPSWDQTLPASTRFIVLSNSNSEAVLDRETGLVWQRSPGAAIVNWGQASASCLERTTGNRAGWRLPTINELASLFDVSSTAMPPLPSGHPFLGIGTGERQFWSATLVYQTSGWRYLVSYGQLFGFFLYFDLAGNDLSANGSAWCVRGGLLSGVQ